VKDDLGFNFAQAAPWFPHHKDCPYVLVRVSEEHAQSWAARLGLAVRRCYVSDSIIDARALELGVEKGEIIAAHLPDPGPTMAGDFGEILVYFYQGTKELPGIALGPKKWRLKQDRTKPAPHSDVVQFVLPSWPRPSAEDVLLCAEVKTKSTKGRHNPIESAIRDGAKDRTSRLARTLAWLRERVMRDSLADVRLEQLERFINATEYPPAAKRFRAVAVICNSLVDEELKNAPDSATGEYTVVVIAVPDLKKTYSAVFRAAKDALPPVTRHKSGPPPAFDGLAK
jgi:hypothetical protein